MKNLNNYSYINNICKDCASVLFFANNNLINDKNILFNAIKTDHRTFLLANENLKHNFEFTIECIKYSAKIVNLVQDNLLNNIRWVKQAILSNPSSFKFLCLRNATISKNITLCLLASKQAENIEYIDSELFKAKNFAELVVKNNPLSILQVIKKLPNAKMPQVDKLCLMAIAANAYAYVLLPANIATNQAFIQRAIFQNIAVKEYLPNNKGDFNIKIGNINGK